MNTVRESMRDMDEFSAPSASRMVLDDRRRMSVTGVRDIDSFDESNVTLVTELGMMSIHGENLRINNLSVSTGEIDIEGEVWAIEYSDVQVPSQKRGFLSRLFG